MQNVAQTIISQYATSATLLQLIYNMDSYIDPSADINAFYNSVWDIDQAVGFGLDNWGKIVGVSRAITVPVNSPAFGFNESTDGYPFGAEPFYAGPQTGSYLLSDTAFRTLILVKALANISNCTAASYNQLLNNLFSGRGNCFISDLGNMQMRYTFEFVLQPWELSIIQNSGVFPRPAGVSSFGQQIDQVGTFGFAEAGSGYQPFGYGVFAQPQFAIQ